MRLSEIRAEAEAELAELARVCDCGEPGCSWAESVEEWRKEPLRILTLVEIAEVASHLQTRLDAMEPHELSTDALRAALAKLEAL